MRRPAALVALLALVLSACTTTGAPNGWAGSPRRPAADVGRPAPSRPARLPAGRPVPDAPEAGSLVLPVAGVEPGDLHDSFTAARSGGRTHHAIDIAAPRGTPVVAVTAGVVRQMTWNALGGRTLYLTGADGRHEYYYAHLDAYADGLEEGRRVRRGDALGTVGQTGNARSPHLHFQILARGGAGRGTPVNPYPVLREAGTVAARRP